MQVGDTKLWWDGESNQPVVLIAILPAGWLIRLSSGLLVGPVEESKHILR